MAAPEKQMYLYKMAGHQPHSNRWGNQSRPLAEAFMYSLAKTLFPPGGAPPQSIRAANGSAQMTLGTVLKYSSTTFSLPWF